MAAAAGDLAVAGVAGRPVATGLKEAEEATEEAVKAGALREAVEDTEEAEATGPKGAWRAAEAATRLAAEVTLLAGAARAADEAMVLREAAMAAEAATAEAGREGVVLPVVGGGTAPAVGVVRTRGRSLGEGPPEDPGNTSR